MRIEPLEQSLLLLVIQSCRVLDNHRSAGGNSAEGNGLWYTSSYPESAWLDDWVNVQRWVHGVAQSGDTIALNYYASDGFPVVIGYDLRNEPQPAVLVPYTLLAPPNRT
jgi:endoglucanase